MENVIKQKTGTSSVVFICKTGSVLFCTNCKDNDYWAVVSDNPSGVHKFFEDGKDVFVLTVEEFEQRLNFSDKTLGLYNLTLEFAKRYGHTIYGDCPLEFNWFAHKHEAVKACLALGDRSFFAEAVFGKNGSCQKNMVWALATYYAILNNSVEFTEKQKEQLQLCHDQAMPKERAYELKAKLIELHNSL